MADVEKKYTDKTEIQEAEKSLAMMLIEDAKINAKRWFLCLIITNALWAFMFCFYVWLPDSEETTTTTIEATDTGHAIYNDNGAEVNISGESD